MFYINDVLVYILYTVAIYYLMNMAITFTENTLTFVFNGMDMTVTNDAIST